MIPSAVTISLVAEARGGPFVYWDDLGAACLKAGKLGYDAVEIFPPGPDALDSGMVQKLLADNKLKLAAVGTGAGWVKHKLHLCLPEARDREKARAFIRATIDFAGQVGAPAIIGSMQGRWGDVPLETATAYLIEALNELGEHAKQYGVPLIYEPLNRYETNHCNTIGQGVALIEKLATKNVVLLADLFHLNIEEVDTAEALKAGGKHVGHLHFVDSNRRPAGCGHIDFMPIAAALKDMGYSGYASAEAFPYPDSDEAARLTMQAYRKHFGDGI